MSGLILAVTPECSAESSDMLLAHVLDRRPRNKNAIKKRNNQMLSIAIRQNENQEK